MAERAELTAEQVEKILICASTPSDHSNPMLPHVMKTMRELCASHESLRKDAERWRKVLKNHHTVTVIIATEHNTAAYSGERLTDAVDAMA